MHIILWIQAKFSISMLLIIIAMSIIALYLEERLSMELLLEHILRKTIQKQTGL